MYAINKKIIERLGDFFLLLRHFFLFLPLGLQTYLRIVSLMVSDDRNLWTLHTLSTQWILRSTGHHTLNRNTIGSAYFKVALFGCNLL